MNVTQANREWVDKWCECDGREVVIDGMPHVIKATVQNRYLYVSAINLDQPIVGQWRTNLLASGDELMSDVQRQLGW